jgi:uncharacterized protein DUF1698
MASMLKRLSRWVRGAANAASAAQQGPPGAAPTQAAILEQYIRTTPSAQNALDVFKDEWWSALPPPFNGLRAGALPVYDDPRIHWALETLGGVAGLSVLELGPLEGGHTYMLEKAGARTVVAIEASTRAFLKCLIVKEILGLERSRFVLGDFEEYLRDPPERFEAVIASGVLYHVRNPVELIHNLARVTDRLFIWTHYYDKERVARIPHIASRISAGKPAEHAGFAHSVHRYNYGDFLDTNRFAGGSEEYSQWLNRDDLVGALRHAGFDEVVIGHDDVEHVNGPSISLVARRT